MIIPLFGAHMSGAEFQFPDLILKEPTSKMAIRLQKVGVTRANCPIWWKPFVTISPVLSDLQSGSIEYKDFQSTFISPYFALQMLILKCGRIKNPTERSLVKESGV